MLNQHCKHFFKHNLPYQLTNTMLAYVHGPLVCMWHFTRIGAFHSSHCMVTTYIVCISHHFFIYSVYLLEQVGRMLTIIERGQLIAFQTFHFARCFALSFDSQLGAGIATTRPTLLQPPLINNWTDALGIASVAIILAILHVKHQIKEYSEMTRTHVHADIGDPVQPRKALLTFGSTAALRVLLAFGVRHALPSLATLAGLVLGRSSGARFAWLWGHICVAHPLATLVRLTLGAQMR